MENSNARARTQHIHPIELPARRTFRCWLLQRDGLLRCAAAAEKRNRGDDSAAATNST
jgi:hypothetical protein